MLPTQCRTCSRASACRARVPGGRHHHHQHHSRTARSRRVPERRGVAAPQPAPAISIPLVQLGYSADAEGIPQPHQGERPCKNPFFPRPLHPHPHPACSPHTRVHHHRPLTHPPTSVGMPVCGSSMMCYEHTSVFIHRLCYELYLCLLFRLCYEHASVFYRDEHTSVFYRLPLYATIRTDAAVPACLACRTTCRGDITVGTSATRCLPTGTASSVPTSPRYGERTAERLGGGLFNCSSLFCSMLLPPRPPRTS